VIDIQAAVLGSTIPFLAAIASGPFITSVRVHLPSNARRSKEELLRFANNTPPNTRLRLQFIRWAPWLVTRDMFFADFRRLPKSKIRLSNLEIVPEDKKEAIEKLGWQGRVLSKYFNRYWANMTNMGRDRSSAPGVWDGMWKQIPYAGEVVKTLGKGERKPAVMQNRASSAQQLSPPPRLAARPLKR